MNWNKSSDEQENTDLLEKDKTILPIRKKIIFHGRVQGVGFRFQLTRAARSLGLVGWVKNRGDLTVEAEAQGEEEKIHLLVKYMRSLSRPTVTKVQSTELPLVDGEKDFLLLW